MTGKKRGGGKGQMPFPALYFFCDWSTVVDDEFISLRSVR